MNECVALTALGCHNFVTHTTGVALTALGWLLLCVWSPVVGCDAAVFCVAGVALGDINAAFAWQVRS